MQNSLRYIREQLLPYYQEEEIRHLAQRIISFVCSTDCSLEILRCKGKEISPDERNQIENIVSRLQRHEPIQYILGETEFYGLTFGVTSDVLIPRPETEELVDLIVSDCRSLESRSLRSSLPLDFPQKTPLTVLDIGTGSGCIAISLAKCFPSATIYGLDVSAAALSVASANAKRNGVAVRWEMHDIFKPIPSGLLPATFDVIVSNPPYVTESEKAQMEANVLAYEPHLALFVSDDNPLVFYHAIADLGLQRLKHLGRIYVETGSLYGKATAALFLQKGYREAQLMQDISGNDRIVRARKI
ncbi:MAG: peptide chain release factor N(5)-glutamine methyltransferase [Dysgonamonadaceae bacterium]|nr:peptide chain release factor N(5)-glutamine methyltransferase [Dysgonamonadaceae bacterium]